VTRLVGGVESGRGGHQPKVIELAGAIRLRDALGLDDGGVVALDL